MTEWYFVWVEGLRGPVPQKWSSDGLWGQVGRQDVIVRFTLMMRRRICRSTNWQGGIRFPTGDSRPRRWPARSTSFRTAFADFEHRLSAEHCEFNFVAGLNGRKEAPLSRVQFAVLAD